MDPRNQRSLVEALADGKVTLKSSAEDLKRCAEALNNLAKKGLVQNEADSKLYKEFSKAQQQASSLGVDSGKLSTKHDLSFGGRVPLAQEQEVKTYLQAVEKLKGNVAELKQNVADLEQKTKLRR